jgi:probable phosphoglycerate mutase
MVSWLRGTSGRPPDALPTTSSADQHGHGMGTPDSEATRILITRHGFSEHNLRGDVFMGRAPDSPLTEEGREQARRLGRRLASADGVTHIIASSLPRTMETARLIGEQVGIARVDSEQAFWELSKGNWEGVMPRRLPPEVARGVAADPFGYRYGEAESYRDVVGRIAPVFDRWVGAHPGATLLFVLHGDVIRALLYHTIRFPPDKISDFVIDPCSLTELTYNGGRYHVVCLNDASHLA